MADQAPGTLYLCATPLGNLKDITLRVLETLAEVEVIAAEDTRRTIKLLNYYQVKKPLVSYHEHNKAKRGPELINLLQEGKSIALVADAGTPGISDPGCQLVKECIGLRIPVTSLPGPCAAVLAATLTGFSLQEFAFYGLPGPGKKERKRSLQEICRENKMVIFYESPHRLTGTLKEIVARVGPREAAVCRELTKKFEEVRRGTLPEIIAHYEEHPPRGEVTVVMGPPAKACRDRPGELEEGLKEVRALKEAGIREKESVKIVSRLLNLDSRELYQGVIAAKKGE